MHWVMFVFVNESPTEFHWDELKYLFIDVFKDISLALSITNFPWFLDQRVGISGYLN